MLVNAFTRYLFSIFYRGCNRPKSIHFEFRTAKLRLLFDTGVNSRIIVGFFSQFVAENGWQVYFSVCKHYKMLCIDCLLPFPPL